MPYVNYGGLLTEDKQFAEPILQRAIELGRQLGVRHIELRHLENIYSQLPARRDKVSMWLSLPETAQELTPMLLGMACELAEEYLTRNNG